jgi:predicted CoA-binding protein
MQEEEREVAERILRDSRSIAVLGMKDPAESMEPAAQIPEYLRQQGYRIMPVNPELVEAGYPDAVATLAELPEAPDVVEVFRNSEAVAEHADELLALHPKAVWLQLGIRNDAAAERLRAAGIEVVQDACMFKVHAAMAQAGRSAE